jgi:hypothetical protein
MSGEAGVHFREFISGEYGVHFRGGDPGAPRSSPLGTLGLFYIANMAGKGWVVAALSFAQLPPATAGRAAPAHSKRGLGSL